MASNVSTDLSEMVEQALQMSQSATFPEHMVNVLNAAGVSELMRGNTVHAIDCFQQALEQSGSDELRAQSLANIGDYARRVEGDSSLARSILERAESLSDVSLATQSRIRSMMAMTYMLDVEQGHYHTSTVARAVEMLEEAVGIAQLSQAQQTEDGLKAESFAMHRLAGIVCRYGSVQEKQELACKTIPDFVSRLDAIKDAPEMARFNYSRALCLVDVDTANRVAAIEMLLTSARTIEPSSPIDACYYFAKAGEWLHAEGCIDQARYCLERAQQHFGVVQTHANAKATIEQVEQLALLLSE